MKLPTFIALYGLVLVLAGIGDLVAYGLDPIGVYVAFLGAGVLAVSVWIRDQARPPRSRFFPSRRRSSPEGSSPPGWDPASPHAGSRQRRS